MRYRKIAQGQLRVSTVCLGCWALGNNATWGPQDEDNSIAAIHAAIEAGINFFDTAPGYGESERVLGEALKSKRQKVLISTKVGQVSGDKMTAACERSLNNLRTDYIDVYHIHWPKWNLKLEDTVRAMEDLKASGKIRHLAVSNFGRQDLTEFLSFATPAVNQLCYSLLSRAIEFEILPVCRAADVPVTCYSPLMQSLLTGKFRNPDEVPDSRARNRLFRGDRPMAEHGEAGAEEETFAAIAGIVEVAREAGLDMAAMSLAWLLGRDGVAGVVAGARSPEQVRHNAAGGDLTLTDDVTARLDEITEPLKQKMGPNADMWESPSRIR